MATQLPPWLLDKTLIEYTFTVIGEAIRSSDSLLQEYNKERATHALQFFLDILDPSVEEEKKLFDIFKIYNDELNGELTLLSDTKCLQEFVTDPAVAAKIIQSLPSPRKSPSRISGPKALYLTAAQRVLSLPDTLNQIFTFIPFMTRHGRETLRHTALVSRAFRNAAQTRLWMCPRDLCTVEQQVRFAFGTAISSANGSGLGRHVRRLRLRILPEEWNLRLMEKIVAFTPGVVDLSLHLDDGGDFDDSPRPAIPATPRMVTWLHKILSSLPNLTHLTLLELIFTSLSPSEGVPSLQYAPDAHIPFTKLEYLRCCGFVEWYWEPISRGLGPALKELNVDFEGNGNDSDFSSDRFVRLSENLTSLTTLRATTVFDIHTVRSLIENLPNLERIDITDLGETDDERAAAIVGLVVGIKQLKELRFNRMVGSAQLSALASSPGPLETLDLMLRLDRETDGALENLLKRKSKTLKNPWFCTTSYVDGYAHKLEPSDKLTEALANIPLLERIAMDFDIESSHDVSPSSINKLLKQCPNLEWTDSLDFLVAGSPLYQEEYRDRLLKIRDQYEEEDEENILEHW